MVPIYPLMSIMEFSLHVKLDFVCVPEYGLYSGVYAEGCEQYRFYQAGGFDSENLKIMLKLQWANMPRLAQTHHYSKALQI